MENMAKEFEYDAENERILLYSGFFIYDELVNCALAVMSFLVGVTAFLGSFSSFMAISHAMLGLMMGGACFAGCCVSIFSVLVTMVNGLPARFFTKFFTLTHAHISKYKLIHLNKLEL